jgi:hypothetical protein
MSLNANRARLSSLTSEISRQWEDTRNYWKDAKSLEFGKKYLEQLQMDVDKAVTVCDQLEKIINQVRSDCE